MTIGACCYTYILITIKKITRYGFKWGQPNLVKQIEIIPDPLMKNGGEDN
jgi:hypothetical protein